MTLYRPAGELCVDCSGPVSRQSRTGRCKGCVTAYLNSDPEVHARRVGGIRKKWRTDPEYKARKVRAIHERHMRARQNPEVAARLNQNILNARYRLSEPEVIERYRAGVKRAGAERSRKAIAWCPPKYRDEYRSLTRSRQMKAPEAKAAILAKAAAEMTPFERQLEKVRNGAGIIEVRPIRRPDPTYTLGGVSCTDGATG